MKPPAILVVSDIHIGIAESHVAKLIEFLEKTKFDTIIFNGDIFDILTWLRHSPTCFKEHWPYIKKIMKLIKGKKAYYLPGNHDRYSWLLLPFSLFLGIKIRQRVRYKNCIIEHGDAIELYLKIRRLFNKDIIIYTDPGESGEEDFHQNCMEFAKIKNKILVVGHSHVKREEDYLFYDEGDWVKNDSYLTIEGKYGNYIQLKNYIE
jgi:UDP-2,3-diacylglucosamine pyrophosphatase LpxH